MFVHAKLHPAFGGRTRPASYYAEIRAVIASLRPATSLREIAETMNRAGLRTARDLEWNKTRVVAFLRDNRTA